MDTNITTADFNKACRDYAEKHGRAELIDLLGRACSDDEVLLPEDVPTGSRAAVLDAMASKDNAFIVNGKLNAAAIFARFNSSGKRSVVTT